MARPLPSRKNACHAAPPTEGSAPSSGPPPADLLRGDHQVVPAPAPPHGVGTDPCHLSRETALQRGHCRVVQRLRARSPHCRSRCRADFQQWLDRVDTSDLSQPRAAACRTNGSASPRFRTNGSVYALPNCPRACAAVSRTKRIGITQQREERLHGAQHRSAARALAPPSAALAGLDLRAVEVMALTCGHLLQLSHRFNRRLVYSYGVPSVSKGSNGASAASPRCPSVERAAACRTEALHHQPCFTSGATALFAAQPPQRLRHSMAHQRICVNSSKGTSDFTALASGSRQRGQR